MADVTFPVDIHGLTPFGQLTPQPSGSLTGSLVISYGAGAGTFPSVGTLTFTDISGNVFTFTNPPVVQGFPGGPYSIVGQTAVNGVYTTTFSMTWSGGQAYPAAHLNSLNLTETTNGGATTVGLYSAGPLVPIVCFASGTLIRTPGGDVVVESLKVGDLVLTSSGAARPVKWLGHRNSREGVGLSLRTEVIRIAADAFGPARPAQDLVVSPGHSICVDIIGEVMIPAGYLVNGATITRELASDVTLWHVELDSHDVLIANNLAAESYLAMSNRGFFAEEGATLHVFEEGVDKSHADFCRPVVTEGPVLTLVRERLAARAMEMGWKTVIDADLHLLVDGQVRRPLIEGGAAVFMLPAGASDVRLMSNTFRPSSLGGQDTRALGVLLMGLSVTGSNGESRRIELGSELLKDGVYGLERSASGAFRWTSGALVLDSKLWSGLAGTVSLFVSFDDRSVRGWVAPARQSVDADKRPKLYAVG